MPISHSPLLKYISTFLGTVVFGFGVHYTLFPRSAFSHFGFALPTAELELIDALMVLYGVKDLFMGVSVWAATWSGNRKVAGINVLALGLGALVDGFVVKGVAGTGEWNHWGYGSVAVGAGLLLLLGILVLYRYAQVPYSMRSFLYVPIILTYILLSSPYGFDPKAQRIDISAGSGHGFLAPSSKYYRGPCPGLNALANHGFIPRNGIATMDQIINASVNVFGMSPDQASLVVYYSTAFAVSPDLDHISIGAPLNNEIARDPKVQLKINPQGLNFPHTGLEHDASATRLDKYDPASEGNNYDLDLGLFEQLLDRQKSVAGHKVNYNIKVLADHRYQRLNDSVTNDPMFFLQPFGGLFLNGNKYALIHRMFANHSVEHPMGRLDRKTLMSFFGVEEDGQNKLKYTRGGERIPDIWYRRPLDSLYDLKMSNDDLLEMASYHPALIDKFGIGGNTQGVNTYQNVSVSDLSGGTHTIESLRGGYNLSCFGLLSGSQLAPV
ncbi:hypothetical protein P280DRAFT_507320 [Massarina eburnea CBS 473.64]|uniref:Heme haloperoxidase family profile domain-containing protein n=1 Tax=Massarina eburnea CBS 473.64 TaxID=1395130 RepID=A0A6A6S2T2_9PLEO|nr:hypothetical protein P280DRAFT_507320 [Massarina eburnea CBS 473.64]